MKYRPSTDPAAQRPRPARRWHAAAPVLAGLGALAVHALALTAFVSQAVRAPHGPVPGAAARVVFLTTSATLQHTTAGPPGPPGPAAPEPARRAQPPRPPSDSPSAAPQAGQDAAGASEAVGTTEQEPQPLRTHWPAGLLDRAALPYSQPQWQALDGCVTSGQPLRLRLYISAHGEVERVQTLEAAEEDGELLQRLDAIFRATRYVPGRRDGVDVASYTDVLIETAAAALP